MARKNKQTALDLKYSTGNILKRVLLYALKSKMLIIISFVFLLIYSLLEIIQPLIIKAVLDDELAGVQTVWVETQEETDVFFEGRYFTKYEEGMAGDYLVSIRYFDEDTSYVLVFAVLSPHEQLRERINATSFIAYHELTGEYRTVTTQDLSVAGIGSFFAGSQDNIIALLIFYAVVSLVVMITRFLQHVSFTQASMRLTLDMRKSAFEKLNRLPINYFAREPHGKTVTKVTYDSEGVQGLYQVVFSIISAAIALVMVYGGLFYLDWKLALLTFLAAPFVYLWLTVYRRTINKYNKSIREMNSRINGKLAEFVNGVGIIQLFNREEMMSTEYDQLLTKNYHTKMKSLRVNTLFGFEMLVFIRRIAVAFVLLYFGFQYFSPTVLLAATTIYVYIEYLEKLINPIADIFTNLNSLEDSLVSASRIFELLDHTEDTGLGKVTGVSFTGKIEFEHINFQYERDNYVLKDVSFSVEAGQFIGLVGHTGSGKSTLMSLLERFYDLEEGRILLDGVDYHNYSKQDVRKNIGIILQDAAIFEGTIKSNIALDEEVSDQEVEEILLKIGAKKFVSEYPKGIHTPISYMGDNLSTGEKQLISFARILLRNPSIMVLDEATANIDTETESLIQHALSVLSENRTTFVVAHRLSTIKNADKIYVLEDGRIIESGTHQTLYNTPNGKYRGMYDAQYQFSQK